MGAWEVPHHLMALQGEEGVVQGQQGLQEVVEVGQEYFLVVEGVDRLYLEVEEEQQLVASQEVEAGLPFLAFLEEEGVEPPFHDVLEVGVVLPHDVMGEAVVQHFLLGEEELLAQEGDELLAQEGVVALLDVWGLQGAYVWLDLL